MVIALCLSILLPGVLHATDYRVSTPAQITEAMASVRPGDTLTMTNGNWKNALIVFQAIGTKAAPILLRAETYGGVILSGSSNLKICGRNLVVDGLLFRDGSSPSGDVIEFRGPAGESDSCRLTNSSIIEYNPADSTKDNKWVSLYGTYNRVDHCYLKGKRNSGTTLVVWLSAKPNYHQIDHNYFANRPVLYGWNGGETIRVGTSDWSMYDSFTIVEYNLFEECNGEIETISSKSCGNIYRYNTFVSCQGTLTLRHGNRCTVEGNFFFGNRAPNSGGIRIIGEDHKVFNNYVSGTDGSSLKSALTIMNGVPNSPLDRYFQVKRAMVVFNTFVDNSHTLNLGGGKDSEVSLPPLDCVIANNIVQGTSAPLITLTDVPVNMTWQGNIFYGTSLGMTQPQGITVVNPQISLFADGLWRPAASSPAVDAAVGSFPYVTIDMDGHVRTGQFDIGADELSAAPVILRPLTKRDVGPPSQMISSAVEGRSESSVPEQNFWLRSNYPNPFNPTTNFEFRIAKFALVNLRVFDVLGKEVATIVNDERQTGIYKVTWDASSLPSGVYYYRLQAGAFVETKQMVLIK
ncbi:MAG: T9SS type A sorting domain-containing protein [Ignavibacteriales bacterium]|nr:T9SS type A sorting domain-containing protein [Ignavibacteriales bacterium]